MLAALLAEQHVDLAQMVHAASVEPLTMGRAASLAAALLPPRHLTALCGALWLAAVRDHRHGLRLLVKPQGA